MAKRPGLRGFLLLLSAALLLGGCGGGISDPAPTSTGSPAAEGSDTNAPDSVNDVVTDEFPGELGGVGGDESPAFAAIAIRNAAESAAAVTVLFAADGVQVHIAYVRVLPGTIVQVSSPAPANRIQINATTDDGALVLNRTFALGVDYEIDEMIEFTLEPNEGGPPGDGTADPGDGFAPPVFRVMSVEIEGLSAAIGSAALVRWEDEGGSPQSTVAFHLRSLNDVDPSSLGAQVSPQVALALDGINDEIRLVLSGVPAGAYELLAVVRDGSFETTVIAAPQLTLFRDPLNAPPTIRLVSPAQAVTMSAADAFDLCWDDADPDSSAVVSLSLFRVMPSGESVSYPLAGPLPEDPDGAADCVRVIPSQVIPGVYDLVATISDGVLSGVDRRERWIEIRGTETDHPPTLTLLAPAANLATTRGGAVSVSWHDDDSDSSAIISLMLDPDLSSDALDGNEVLLVSALAEDPDGAGNDEIRIGFPADIAAGEYRLAGTIWDGRTSAVSFAAGKINITDRGSDEQSESPEVDAVWPLTDQRIRDGYGLTFGARFSNVAPGDLGVRYFLKGVLAGESWSVDLLPISTELRNGSAFTWTADLSRISIPDEIRAHRLELRVQLFDGDRLVASDAAPGAVFIRRELAPLEVGGVLPDCEAHGGVPADARIEFGWVGGGSAVHDPANIVRFWLAKDGVWPPPLDDDRTHRIILLGAEQPGVVFNEAVPWEALTGMDPGLYTLIAEIQDPQFGEITHAFTDRRIEVCAVGRQGGGGLP
ncbi:MAG: hypothetical protein FLDDKLPJ_02526 [Phycisphaerae bacterium]|nr:hypothetical protein [Phycisphaerae bacterium]